MSERIKALGKQISIKVFCVHPESEANIQCDLIEWDTNPVFKCPYCGRMIVLSMKGDHET